MPRTDREVQELVRRIDGQGFRVVRLKPGYDMGAVDDLLDRLAAALRAGQQLRPLLSVRPPVVRFRAAYCIESVDAFVNELLHAVGEREWESSTVAPAPPTTPHAHEPTEPVDVIQEQQSLWRRFLEPD